MQGIELPPLMRTLSLLEKQGYLVRSTSPYDKRIRLLTLTAEGRAILEKLSCVIETYQRVPGCRSGRRPAPCTWQYPRLDHP